MKLVAWEKVERPLKPGREMSSAQLVGGDWYTPIFGSDSLSMELDEMVRRFKQMMCDDSECFTCKGTGDYCDLCKEINKEFGVDDE